MADWAVQKGQFTLQDFCLTWDVSKATARVYISRIKDRLDQQGIPFRHVNYFVVGNASWEQVLSIITGKPPDNTG